MLLEGDPIRQYYPITSDFSHCRPYDHLRLTAPQWPMAYLKAFIIHTRGALSAYPCQNNCTAAVRGDKQFTAFASCVLISGV